MAKSRSKAARPTWEGHLRLSLVTCPVAMLPATSDTDKVRFHTVNRATGHRVHARYVDAETGKAVADKDQVKGYERADGEYVMLEDEELDAVALESRNEPVAARKRLARRRATTSSISWHA